MELETICLILPISCIIEPCCLAIFFDGPFTFQVYECFIFCIKISLIKKSLFTLLKGSERRVQMFFVIFLILTIYRFLICQNFIMQVGKVCGMFEYFFLKNIKAYYQILANATLQKNLSERKCIECFV